MDGSMFIGNQLLATKFYVPVASHTLISRPRLSTLLQESLKHPLTVISAPAGFGKTMLLSAWGKSLPADNPLMAWVSLDEDDNEARLFWINVLTALDMQKPELFTPLLKYLQSPQTPPLNYILGALTNLLVDETDHFLLILDDFHMITEQQVHTTLAYLVERLPPQLHIILATRTDPPLPLSLLRVRGQLLEMHTDHLRCTVEEIRAYFYEVMGIKLPDETIQEVLARTEGWLVGLQLLGLSLRGPTDSVTLLEELSGDQRYILDYLTEEVLGRQPQDVQTFLLSTCILERLMASLCDAVTEQSGSQRMLERLEHANLFVVSLDNKRQWYRYHALFAEALRYRLEHAQGDLVPTLHYRASLWYAHHNQTTQAILHAFNAHKWQWAADLIERLPLLSMTWGAGEHELVLLRQWLDRLPWEVVQSRPRLCLACTQMLWAVAPCSRLQAWFNAAETMLTASLTAQDEKISPTVLTPHARQEQQNLLGEVIAWRAAMRSFEEDGQAVLALCQQALSLLSPGNCTVRAQVAAVQLMASYSTSVTDVSTSVQNGLQASLLAQEAGYIAVAISVMGAAALHMIGTGQLRETQRLTQQVILLGAQSGDFVLPEVGWPSLFQAEVLREWNELDAALSVAEKAILLCKQTESILSLMYLLLGYAVLLRIYLSRGELDRAHSALCQLEHISMSMNQPASIHVRSYFTTVDQVRLWLARKELDCAEWWAEGLGIGERHGSPFVHEREEVAQVRLLLAKDQPALALERLGPVLQGATVAQRWNHVIEIRLLQALAHQMYQEEARALFALSEALRLAEPESYIRRFVDEGTPVAALLSRFREQQCKHGPTPYLDTLLAAFPHKSKADKCQPKRARQRTKNSLPR